MRKLFATVAVSILRFGAAAWSNALVVNRNVKRLESTHRSTCLRMVCSYRTVSKDAVCVLASMMPIALVVAEDEDCFKRRGIRGARGIARTSSLLKWQRESDSSSKVRWTHRLISSVSKWTRRPHGEMNIHLTQFLSGHGCFRWYMHRFGHAGFPACPECADCDETAELLLFGAMVEYAGRRYAEEISLRTTLLKGCVREWKSGIPLIPRFLELYLNYTHLENIM